MGLDERLTNVSFFSHTEIDYVPNFALACVLVARDWKELLALVRACADSVRENPERPLGSDRAYLTTRKPLGGECRETFASPVQLPRVYRLYHLPKMGHPDWIAADLLSSVLSGDKSSRLERSLVMEQEIATDVAAYVLPTEATGMMMVQATAREEIPIAQVEAAVDAEIARIVRDGVSEEEMVRARNRAEVEYAHQIENYDSRADLIAMMATYFGDPKLVHTWLDPYRKTTSADVARVAAQYLVADNRVTTVFMPAGEAA